MWLVAIIVAPLTLGVLVRVMVPNFLAADLSFETTILLGILVGPQVLGWADAGPTIEVLASFGLAFLFFLAGFEIDFPAIRGQPLLLAALGWLASLVPMAPSRVAS